MVPPFRLFVCQLQTLKWVLKCTLNHPASESINSRKPHRPGPTHLVVLRDALLPERITRNTSRCLIL